MPRAVWRGSISFGMVTVPVRLYPAVRRREVRFRELDRLTGQRVRHQRVRQTVEFDPRAESRMMDEPAEVDQPAQPAGRPFMTREHRAAGRQPAPPGPLDVPVGPAASTAGEEVSRSEIVRGYEVAPGRFVEVSDQDLDQLAPERTRTIDVEQFVSRSDLDPILFESWYHVVPDADRLRPFALLLRAMQETNRAAICWLVLRSRRHLAALQPRASLMLLSTLLFADEVVPGEGLEPILPTDLTRPEVDMAELLIDTLSGPFEPERYRDDYRERLLELIESRAGGALPLNEPEVPPAATSVHDLMAALTASVEQARARRGQAENASAPGGNRRQRAE